MGEVFRTMLTISGPDATRSRRMTAALTFIRAQLRRE
jgi:hypothetical protein